MNQNNVKQMQKRMNKTLFLFIRKFYAGLTDMRIPKQIESEQSNVIENNRK